LLTSFTDGQGAVSYGYDAGNELVSASEPGGDCTTNPGVNCTRFGYNANGARISTTYPGGTVQNTTVDPSGRPLRITATGPGANGAGTGTVFSDLGYGYTAGTRVCTVVQTRSNTVAEGAPNGSSTNYTYDSLNRLTTAAENLPGGGLNAAWSYAYDGAGNRTAQHVVVPGGQTVDTSYTYTPDNRLTQRNGDPTNIAYDPTGNQTSYPATGALPGNTTAASPQTSTQYDTANHSTIVTSAGTPVTMTYLNPDQNQRVTAGGTYYGTGVLGVSYQTTNAATTTFTRTPGAAWSARAPAVGACTTSPTTKAPSSASSTAKARRSPATPTTPTAPPAPSPAPPPATSPKPTRIPTATPAATATTTAASTSSATATTTRSRAASPNRTPPARRATCSPTPVATQSTSRTSQANRF